MIICVPFKPTEWRDSSFKRPVVWTEALNTVHSLACIHAAPEFREFETSRAW